MTDYQSLENRFKKGLESPYVKTGIALGTATLATIFLNDSHASQDIIQYSQDIYGFFSGIRDGLLWLPNLVISIFEDSTLASDSSGIISNPNTGLSYFLGFGTMVGSEGLFCAMMGQKDNNAQNLK